MSELNEKLLEIKRQKDTYIIPENLKKNVEVFGITGTLEPGSGSGDVKLFETIADMQADADPQEGDLAVVYRDTTQPVQEDSEFSSCIFPNTVVLDEAFTGNVYERFRQVDDGYFDGMMNVSSTVSVFQGYGESSEIRVQYTSQDGITYTRTDGGEELVEFVEFGTTIKWQSMGGPFHSIIGNFMKIGGNYFDGLYEYKTNQYRIAPTQLTLLADKLLSGITGYGKNGITVGNFGTNVSTAFNDDVAKIYAKAQIVYNDMTPLVASNNNKRAGLSSDIVLVPCKSDGIPLLDTSSVTNMNDMFQDCKKLIEVSSLNTSNAISMHSMFFGCASLMAIPQLNTSNVTNMTQMFYECTSLKSIPLLDTSNVTTMHYMFSGCTSLTTISQLDTSSVTDMFGMFSSCSSLTTIPLLDTSNATNMNYMFSNCTSLSNESLNNVLAMCTNATSYTGTKTLKYIGINATQAPTCQSLSNWSAFVAAGWTTGY